MVTSGYIYEFYIVVDGQELVFEKDEEGQYRVVAADERKGMDIDPELVQAIMATFSALSV